MGVTRVDGFQIEQDPSFHRRAWTMQRIGWAVMALILVAAVLGLLGSGPLSEATADVPGVMRIEYPRFAQYQTPGRLTVHLEPGAITGSSVSLGIDRRYLDRWKIDSVVPPPRRVHQADERLVYEFEVAGPERALTLVLYLEPQEVGVMTGRVVLEGEPGASAVFRQVVYP
jgi:hypothetical protein